MIEQYYIDNRPKLLKQIAGRGIRKDLVEDVLQESFTRALHYYKTYNKNRPFAPWFNTLMNNVIKAAKKEDKLQGMTTEELKVLAEDEYVDENSQFNSLMRDHLSGELDGRYGAHGDVLHLYFMMNMRIKDICEVTDYKKKNVWKIITSFKKEMAEKYESEDV